MARIKKDEIYTLLVLEGYHNPKWVLAGKGTINTCYGIIHNRSENVTRFRLLKEISTGDVGSQLQKGFEKWLDKKFPPVVPKKKRPKRQTK